MNSAEELAAQVTTLVSFPDVALRIGDMIDDGNSDAARIAAVIEQDPALAATLLRIANSALYGSSASVDSLAKAFMRIGAREIRELTLGICATRAFAGVPNEIVTVRDFWRHSLLCGSAARVVARTLRLREAGMVFTAGLLHDVGHLVMFNQLPQPSLEALALCRDELDGENLHVAEREVLGFDHTDVGRELGVRWRWPSSLTDCIAAHHDPFGHPDAGKAAVLVHVANSLATRVELGLDTEEIAPEEAAPVDPRAWAALGLEADAVPPMLEEIAQASAGMAELFSV